MPAVSEEELEQLRVKNEKLREQLVTAGSKESDNQAARDREYAALQLQAENTRLEARVNQAKAAATVSASREGAAGVLENAQRELEAAQAVAAQGVGPVDTNVENPPKNTTGATVAVEQDSSARATSSNGGNS